MEIRDTIQSDDIRCDGWIDKDTAEASIRQTEATLKRYTPVYDAQCKEYPRGVEPFRDCIFAEWHGTPTKWSTGSTLTTTSFSSPTKSAARASTTW